MVRKEAWGGEKGRERKKRGEGRTHRSSSPLANHFSKAPLTRNTATGGSTSEQNNNVRGKYMGIGERERGRLASFIHSFQCWRWERPIVMGQPQKTIAERGGRGPWRSIKERPARATRTLLP